MEIFEYKSQGSEQILALGAESSGNFSFFKNGKISCSESFGDLLEENNFHDFKKAVLKFLKKEKARPDIILSDLHPVMQTTLWGEQLCKKYKARHIQIQHHESHIFSAIGDSMLSRKSPITNSDSIFYGIAMDGTGYGTDEKIWGGECFAISNLPAGRQVSNETAHYKPSSKKTIIKRIGHLENQLMIGGDLAIREPARMLIGILSKFMDRKEVFGFVKKHYPAQEFEVLYNQLQQNFNCMETSSAGRILDAASLLLGFCNNERSYKHQAAHLLEKNPAKPYIDIEPIITKNGSDDASLKNSKFILETSPLFEYLIKNIHRDSSRLAATVQLYIARGMLEMIKLDSDNPEHLPAILISGGISNNKIVSQYLESHGAYANKKIPRGDEGLSFGQVVHFLLK